MCFSELIEEVAITYVINGMKKSSFRTNIGASVSGVRYTFAFHFQADQRTGLVSKLH